MRHPVDLSVECKDVYYIILVYMYAHILHQRTKMNTKCLDDLFTKHQTQHLVHCFKEYEFENYPRTQDIKTRFFTKYLFFWTKN